jgi:hypothetical protein
LPALWLHNALQYALPDKYVVKADSFLHSGCASFMLSFIFAFFVSKQDKAARKKKIHVLKIILQPVK